MTRWVMLADLERCVGCQTCTAACRHSNATSPAVQWRKVLDVEAGSFPNVSRTFVPVGCQHCADPPCMHVCPTTATRQRPDGIVTIDYNLCIGCAYCEVACPYQARFLVHEPHFAYGPTAMQNEVERYDDERLGVAQKCTFCSDRIDFGLENGLTPGIDERATPACVNACIADALIFGDLDDPHGHVAKLLRQQQHFRMHEEIGTEPGFYYLTGKQSAAAEAPPAPTGSQAEAGKLRTRGVEPSHQTHWDWKAASNFLCGGTGSGLLAFAAAAGLAGAPVLVPGLAALAFVALGLSLLLFKIGRPFRFIYVLRQPQRSWMSREAWIAAPLFAAALAALWFDQAPGLALAALLGFGFLLCQGMMFREAKGIPAWRARTIAPLVFATGLAEGGGVFVSASAVWPPLADFTTWSAIALAALIILRAIAWQAYMGELRRDGVPTRTLDVLAAFQPWFVAFGIAIPLVLILIALAFALPHVAAALLLTAGLSVFVTGWCFKFILVRRAAYNQGFALTRTPVRGTGVAGPAIKPGWTVP